MLLHESSLPQREPHPDFGFDAQWHQAYPFAATLSALSCQVLWTALGLVPAMIAHHLVILGLTALLAFTLVVFVGRRFGRLTGVAAAVFLLLSPRFFGHAFNNLKDVPEACLYAFAVLAGYAALSTGRWRAWLTCGVMTAFALAQKPNALFIPVQLGLFLVLSWFLKTRGGNSARAGRGILIATLAFGLAYLCVSPQFWQDTLARVTEHVEGILRVGNVATSRQETGEGAVVVSVSWMGPFFVLITTPPTLLAAAVVGLLAPGYDHRLRLFLGLWLALPIGRLLLPGMRSFDGVRHILEFYPALAVLGAIGLERSVAAVRLLLQRWTTASRSAVLAVASVATVTVLPCAVVTARTHPNGICYFNSIVGGLAGAQAVALPESTDYWGNSYWQGMRWLGDHAEPGAALWVPWSGNLVRAAAPVRLRADLQLWGTGDPPVGSSLYVMYVTRQEFYGPSLRDIDRRDLAPAHQVEVQGGVILKIHHFGTAAAVAEIAGLRQREQNAHAAQGRLLQWILLDQEKRMPVVWAVFAKLNTLGVEAATELLLPLLPPELHDDARDVLWLRAR